MEFRVIVIVLIINSFNIEVNGANVGLIFDETNLNDEKVFYKAIEDANNQYPELELQGFSKGIVFGNAFDASLKLCELFEESVVAIFGASKSSASKHVFSICDSKEIPFIDTQWNSKIELPGLNLHPHLTQYAIALKDLIDNYEWGPFTILYESGDFFPIVNAIIEEYGPQGPLITVRKYDLDLNGNYRNVLRRVKVSEQHNILVVGSTQNLPEFLKQAQQVGILTNYYKYIIGNLDFQTLELEPYQHSEVNITGYRLISPKQEEIMKLQEFVYNGESNILNVTCGISTGQALMYDGIQILAKTLDIVKIKGEPLSCNEDVAWKAGLTIVNEYKSLITKGLCGITQFDEQNLRSDFQLEAFEFTTSGIIKIGTWTAEDSFSVDRQSSSADSTQGISSLADKTLVVITANSEPYGMLKETSDQLTGNDRYEGIGIELIDELSKKLGFKYEFRMQEDGKYGSEDPITKKWNGMILEILEERADLGITDLTMTSERERAVDFTIPFMNLGIAILFQKPQKEAPKLFSFMSPFSGEVWGYLGVAYISVSIALFILGRISSAEWDNPYPCVAEPTELENQFSFANSLWFTVGALLQQGSEIAPKASSTRTVASIWWFFTLILVSSYTANLAAFLTVESLSTPIENVEDLSRNKGGVQYGAKMDGSTYKFFEGAQYPTYKRMYEYMKSHPELMPKSNPEGVKWAEDKKMNYAFLMESTSLEYEIERKCSLTQVGSLLDEKGYGIAMRKNWVYRNALSQAVLELQEDGTLNKMKIKWWKEKRGGGACQSGSADGDAKPLGMENLAGVYIVLIVGSVLSFFLGILEWTYSVYQRAKELNEPLKTVFMEELRFVMKCSGNTKSIRSNKLTPSSSSKSSLTVDSIETQTSYNDDHKIADKKSIFSKLSKLSKK